MPFRLQKLVAKLMLLQFEHNSEIKRFHASFSLPVSFIKTNVAIIDSTSVIKKKANV